MRANIDIDDDLMAEARKVTKLPTKKAIIEEALRRLVADDGRRRAIREMKGMGWESNFDDMRPDLQASDE